MSQSHTDTQKQQGKSSAKRLGDAASRRKKLAHALRRNLSRRKQAAPAGCTDPNA